MTELPRGTVTLLFTDIEGSTQLQHRLGERYQDVVAEHRRLLEEAFAEQGGTVVDRQTESFFVVFMRARHAVDAATTAQLTLTEHDWPDGVEVKVRMGIHSGEPEVAGDRYVGLAVARAARICAVGHGGQVLLSSSTRSLLADDGRVVLRPLGSYRLKDFSGPEAITQVAIEGLPWKFPPLRAQRATRRRNRLLAAGLVLVLIGAIAGGVVAFTGGSTASLTIGPRSVGVIDPRTNEIVDAIPIGFSSSLIAAGEGFVWVADRNGNTLTKIDPRTRTVVGTYGIAVGAGAVPFGLAAGSGAVWVAVYLGRRQVVYEFGADAVDRRRTIPYGEPAAGPLLNRLQGLTTGLDGVWAIDASAAGVWRIDARKKLGEGLDAISLAAGGGAVWVAGSTGVTKLDPTTGDDLGSATIDSETFGETASVAFDGKRNAVWFAGSGGETLTQIDPDSVATTQTFGIGKGPVGISVDDAAVWVANSRDGTLSRVDPRKGSDATRTIALGQTPGGVVAAYGSVWTGPGEPRS